MAYYGYEFYYDGTRATWWGYFQVALINMGWELHDDISATVKVYKSNGESGNEPYGYIWVDAGTSTYIQFCAYQYWDNATHSGIRPRYTNDSASYSRMAVGGFTTTNPGVLAGDKDTVIAMNTGAYTGSITAVAFGHISVRGGPAPANANGTAGTCGTLAVSSVAGLGVGSRVQIVGAEGCDMTYVSSIIDSGTIVVDKLPRNYGTGAKVGMPASTFGIGGHPSYYGYWYPCSVIGDSGTAGTSTMKYSISYLNSPAFYSYQYYGTQKYVLTPIFIVDLNTVAPGIVVGSLNFKFPYGILTADRDLMIANNDCSFSTAGTASSGSANTLIDSTKSWGADELANRFCVITGGTAGVSTVKKITGNDSTSFTIDTNWYQNPYNGTVYILTDNALRASYTVLSNNIYTTITTTTPPA